MASRKHTIGPVQPTLPCLEPGCIRRFYSRNGRSNHMRSQHPPELVEDVQQPEVNAPTSFNSTPSNQSRGSDHIDSDHNNHDDYNDHNGSELPGDDLNPDIPFDGGEYQHSNGGNQSPGPSNAGSYDQAHDPVVPLAHTINRTYHPIINGGSLFYY